MGRHCGKGFGSRRFVNSIIHEFLEPPVVHIVKKHEDMLRDIQATLPPHEEEQRQKSSITLCFKTLNERADANARLSAKGIQFRNGKTLVIPPKRKLCLGCPRSTS